MAELAHDVERFAGVGHNNPPEPTPYEAIKTHCDDLYEEAKHWLDGATVETQAQADAIGRLLGMLREASKTADDARKDELKPIDEQRNAIQARWNALIGDTKATGKGLLVRAQDACKAALAPWLRKKEEEQRAAAVAAQREAEEKAAAAAAARNAAQVSDLAAQEQAETLTREAEKAQKTAKKAENAKANAGGGAGRAIGLRSEWTPALVDAGAALKHFAQRRPDDLKAFLIDLARQDVRAGVRSIPGFAITETKVPV